MSAIMARPGGRVQLDQSDMRLAFNMAKMARRGFSRAKLQKTQQQTKKAPADVREKTKQVVVFPAHNHVNAALESHPAMVCENQTDDCLPGRNDNAINSQTPWRRKGTGGPPP